MNILSVSVVALLFAFSGCSSSDRQTTNTSVAQDNATTIQSAPVHEDISAEAFAEKLTDPDFVLIDVRTPGEFAEGHLKGALNINFNDPDFATTMNKMDKDKTYLVYCRSGARSNGAANVMLMQGFKTIYTLKGGLLSWKGELE